MKRGPKSKENEMADFIWALSRGHIWVLCLEFVLAMAAIIYFLLWLIPILFGRDQYGER